MARLWNAAIGLSIIVLLFACASQKMIEQKPPPEFKGIVLAKGIDDSGMIGVPQEPTGDFNTEDEQIFAYLAFDNLSGKHNLRWEWITPNGEVYLATHNYPLKANKGKYLPKVTAWHPISLKNEPAAELPGRWSVNVFVDDELIASEPFNVEIFTDPIILPAAVSMRPYPKDWGLIIGIEDYYRLPHVEYARKDALIVRDYFNRILGVPEENIILLIDADASKARIEGYLKHYIPNNIDRDATLYVYFAGHGLPGTRKGEPYLVPYDADTRFIEQTGYKLSSFYQDIHQLEIARSYVFLDSCFSGMASRATEMLIKKTRPTLIHVEKVPPPSNTIISLSATRTNELSNAHPDRGHGLFTYYLLRGLRGEADSDDDGWNSINEIYAYVRKNVLRESRRIQSEQTPTIMPPLEQVKDIAVSRSLK